MPSVYQGECSHWGYTSPPTSVTYYALRLSDDTFQRLRHHGERGYLQAAGYTWERAAKEGRLVNVHILLCGGCGHANEKLVAASQESCLVLLLGLVSIFTLCLLYVPGTVSGRLGTAWGAFFLFAMLYSGYCTLNARRRQKSLPPLTACERCGGSQFHPLNAGHVGICPECGDKAFCYTHIGIS